MTDIKKIKKLIIKGVLKPKVFLILYGLFFSSLATATLTHTWLDGEYPLITTVAVKVLMGM